MMTGSAAPMNARRPSPDGSPFALLGLPASAAVTDEDVRAAWRRIAAATHPDRPDGGDPQRFAAASAAYTTLRTRSGRGEALADRGRARPAARRHRAAARGACRPAGRRRGGRAGGPRHRTGAGTRWPAGPAGGAGQEWASRRAHRPARDRCGGGRGIGGTGRISARHPGADHRRRHLAAADRAR